MLHGDASSHCGTIHHLVQLHDLPPVAAASCFGATTLVTETLGSQHLFKPVAAPAPQLPNGREAGAHSEMQMI